MKKSKLLFLFFWGILLSACSHDKEITANFESNEIVGTWHCHYKDGIATTNSSTTYNADGSYSGFANIIAVIDGENAELKAFAKGTWTIEGNMFIEKNDSVTFKAQNPLGESILSSVQSEVAKIKVGEREVISINKTEIVYRDRDGYITSCLR